jgi:GDP-L-fucose synthase
VLILASSCIYPVNAQQPLQTEEFLKGNPEPTNAGHAVGKTIASWLIKFYRESYGLDWGTAISSSLYGLEDDFSGQGHVVPGLVKRFANSDGSTIEKIWGSESTLREFLFNDDLGLAIKILLQQSKLPELINIGSGFEVTMGELTRMIAKEFNYLGSLEFDVSVPAGWPRRIIDSTDIRSLGWGPKVDLESGLKRVIAHFREVS